MQSASVASVNRLVWTAILAALTAVGAHIQFPIGPVPFSLQTFFVMLCGLILGPVRGPVAILLYIAAGVLGLPVFSKGASGFAHLLGPTGGFLLGFVLQAAAYGLAPRRPHDGLPGELPWLRGVAFGLAGSVLLFTPGVLRLAAVMDTDLARAATVGLLPFIPSDILKMILAIACYRHLRAKRLLPA